MIYIGKNLVGKDWIDNTDVKLKKFSPVDGKLIAEFPAATIPVVDAALDFAEEAFEKWWMLGSVERSKILYRAKELIEKNRKELENLLMIENGKIKPQAVEEVDGALDQIQYYAEFARKITGDVVEGTEFNRKIFQYKVPYGIVVAITPWNFPAGMVARKLAPALLTGNVVILKPSTDTPMTAEWIVKRFIEAGIPPGVLQFITGKGSEIGDYIVSHKKVSLVTMTGSTSTGQRIREKTASNMAKLILELGGKAPFIVWKDADLMNASKALIWAKFWNAGQSCIAAERLFIHDEVYDKFMNFFVNMTKKLRIGSPESSDMGPLINQQALETTEKFVSIAKEEGFKIIIGGKKPDLEGELRNGYFYEPTILEGDKDNSPIFQEEIFGPVIAARRVFELEETIKLANNSKYGLASYLFAKNPEVIFQSADRIMFGELYINMPGPEASQGYHTGFRLTGQAGEGSKYGIEEYLKLKNIYVDYSGKELKIPSMNL